MDAFTPKDTDTLDTVFAGKGLQQHAPKMYAIVNSVKKAQGISFVFSRYVKAGAVPLAIALERAGFQRRLADGTLVPLLHSVQATQYICAICYSGEGPCKLEPHIQGHY
jgi:hypothetical protein